MSLHKSDADEPPVWEGDLDNDCTAHWAGLTLRAEWMDGSDWWWCIYDNSTGEQITSSNQTSERFLSGKAARMAAEKEAQEWLGRSK